MNIRDSYIHGADGKGVVKSLYFATSAESVLKADFSANYTTAAGKDLIFLLADTMETKIGLPIPTLNQNTTGYASEVLTVKKEDNVNYYLTFVDSNNTTADAESVYTDAGIYYNPSTDTLTVGAISGPSIVIGGTTLYLNSTQNTLNLDTVISNTSTNNTIPSSKAVWDAILAGMKANDAMIFMGFLDGGSDLAHTIYTEGADAGYTYKVRTAGYINGKYYQVNDTFICTVDGTVAATSSNVDTIKANWGVVEGNGDYLSINGGTMYGTLSWEDDTALPSTTAADYILVASDDDGVKTANYITKADFRTDLSITDKTGLKKGTAGTTAATGVITANSSTGLILEGGTHEFKVGNGTKSFKIPITVTNLSLTSDVTSLATFTHSTDLIYTAAGGGNTVEDKPTGIDSFGILSFKTAAGYYGQILMGGGGGVYVRSAKTLSGNWKIVATSANVVNDNISVGWNSETTIATIAGIPIKIKIPANPNTNTWRPIRVNNGTSNSVGTATSTKAMNFTSSNLDITYLAAGTGSGQSNSDDYFTIGINAKDWTGATSSAAGTAGYMPGASIANRLKYLRGDGSWIALAPSISAGTTDTNKIKITVGGENSSEFTVPYATNSDTIDGYHANKITDIYFGSWCLGYDTGTYYGKVAEFAYTSTGTMDVSATFLISKYTSSAVNGSANILNIKARATSTTDITCKATWALCTENNIPITITTLKDGNNYYIRIYLESKGWGNVYGCKLLSSHRWATSNMTSWTLYSGTSLSTTTIQYFNGIPASETVVPISISNIGVINNATTIGRDLTTIATVSGVDITAKIASYVLTAGDTMTGNLTRSIANYTRGTAPSSRKVAAYSFVDSDNTTSGWIGHVAETNGQTSLGFYIVTPKSSSDSTNVYRGFSIIKPNNVDYGVHNMTFNIGSGQLTIPASEGTKPLIISSTTLNTNLNADLLDGYHASDFIQVATELVSVSKTLKVDTWTDMATISTYTGTYAIQINSGNVYASGVFTACGGTDSVADEIPLHVADKGTNTWRPYARISGTKLQMTTNELNGNARTYKIKIVKLI